MMRKLSVCFFCVALVLAMFGVPSTALAAKSTTPSRPFAGLTSIQEAFVGSTSFYGVENPVENLGPFESAKIVRVDFTGNGQSSRTVVFEGQPGQKFVSLGVVGRIILITTFEGQLVLADLQSGDSVVYQGLPANVPYGLLIDDPTMSEVGVTNPQTLEIQYLNFAAARWVRTSQVESAAVPNSSIVMGLMGANTWDVAFRNNSGSTRRYLVSCTGSEYTPIVAPSLRQMAYDFSSSASTVTTIATGVVGQVWFGLSFDGTNAYINTKAGGIAKINVNTAVITNLVVTGASKPLFSSDNVVRFESGIPQVYDLDNDCYIHKINGNSGAVTLLGSFNDDVHGGALVLDGNSGLAFTATGYIGGVGKTAIYKCSFTGTGYTIFASALINQPGGVSFNLTALARNASNDFSAINGFSAGLHRVDTASPPWVVICQSAGGQILNLILDTKGTGTQSDDDYIVADFGQGGGSLNRIKRQ